MNRPALIPQDLAEKVRDALWRDDHASQALGMQILTYGPGLATLSMTVRGDMLNGFGICHGGLISTLADSAMAFASNSHNVVAVASSLSVEFIASAQRDDVLSAVATECAKTGRTGVYDVVVTNQHGATVALMRGRVQRIKGKSIAEAG
ncbi:MAG: hydroxyphenylacetyl-CoA thioesterase PaaI [Gammaproteobacteria bacterium]|nr:hydroxyphenylacetyl-CoA thioesterase PaaI [Gammaproteobacteria bacterium]